MLALIIAAAAGARLALYVLAPNVETPDTAPYIQSGVFLVYRITAAIWADRMAGLLAAAFCAAHRHRWRILRSCSALDDDIDARDGIIGLSNRRRTKSSYVTFMPLSLGAGAGPYGPPRLCHLSLVVMGRGRIITSLQIGRGLAALAVVLFHARLGTNSFVAPLPPAIEGILARGNLGVDFFFILSGFIILHVHLDDLSTFAALRSYVFKRLTRIFVPYLPVALIVAIAYCALPGLSGAPRDWGWFTTLTLLPSSSEPALNVAWTLVHEMMFYLLFVLFFCGRPIFVMVMGVWSCAMIYQAINPLAIGSPFLSVLLNPINLEFVTGMACAAAFRACGLPPALGKPSRLTRWFVLLGNASYAIYLIHNPLISLTSRVAARLPVLASWPASLALSVVASLVVGYAYHRCFERPALEWIRSPARYTAAPSPAAY